MKAILKSGQVEEAIVTPLGPLRDDDVVYYGTEKQVQDLLEGKLEMRTPTHWWAYSYLMDTKLDSYVEMTPAIADLRDGLLAYKELFITNVDDVTVQQAETVFMFYQRIWEELPDHIKIHSLPFFDILCDLCSESYLVME